MTTAYPRWTARRKIVYSFCAKCLPLGRAINEDRKRPTSFGPEDVGTEQNSVAHGDSDILFQDEITNWRLLCNCASERRNDAENLTIHFHGPVRVPSIPEKTELVRTDP